MRAVVQRVLNASVTIDQEIKSSIDTGLLVLLGIEERDSRNEIDWLSQKITQLRIFNDDSGTMNLSVKDVNGEILIVSQFTLMADTRKGNRPSYIKAARPEIAIPIYEQFVEQTELCLGKEIKTGVFGADMKINLINDGPVTIIIDTPKNS